MHGWRPREMRRMASDCLLLFLRATVVVVAVQVHRQRAESGDAGCDRGRQASQRASGQGVKKDEQRCCTLRAQRAATDSPPAPPPLHSPPFHSTPLHGASPPRALPARPPFHARRSHLHAPSLACPCCVRHLTPDATQLTVRSSNKTLGDCSIPSAKPYTQIHRFQIRTPFRSVYMSTRLPPDHDHEFEEE